MNSIAIIGVGEVGAAAANGLILNHVCARLLLVDKRLTHRDGQVKDLNTVAYNGHFRAHVQPATYRDAAHADVIVITAAAKKRIGEPGLAYLHRSTATLRNIIDAMKPFKRDAILLIVSNPVDLLTSLAQRLSGLPSAQVIGTGTFLDSVWLKGILANKYEVAASSIDAMVLGEHCGSRFICWPSVSIGGIPIDDFAAPSVVDKLKIAEDCKDEGQSIIEEKGAIVFGIASVVTTLCTSILFNQRRVHPISHMQQDLGCCLSMPAVLGRLGAELTPPVSLGLIEKAELQDVATEMNQILDRLLES